MIEIHIVADGEKIVDKIRTKETCLVENALALRALEKIKKELILQDYDSDMEVFEDED